MANLPANPRKGFIDGGIARRHPREDLFVTRAEIEEMPQNLLDRITRFVPDKLENATVKVFSQLDPDGFVVRIDAHTPSITNFPENPGPPDWLGPFGSYRAPDPQPSVFFDPGRQMPPWFTARFGTPTFVQTTGPIFPNLFGGS